MTEMQVDLAAVKENQNGVWGQVNSLTETEFDQKLLTNVTKELKKTVDYYTWTGV